MLTIEKITSLWSYGVMATARILRFTTFLGIFDIMCNLQYIMVWWGLDRDIIVQHIHLNIYAISRCA